VKIDTCVIVSAHISQFYMIRNFVHIAPNCSLPEGVSIGSRTFVAIGASISSNKTIGK
jgi:UDP-3-O-[3-hydroxymyristoyl] glucosamine N-acyltransferase